MRALFFLFLTCLNLCFSADTPPLHIVTVANYQNIGLERLLFTAKEQGLEIKVMGMNKPYPHHFVKLYNMQKFLKTVPDTDVVMFVDAFDVIFLGGEKEIMRRFLDYQYPIVFAGERNYHPKDSVFDLIGQYFPGKSTMQYLNSGCYIGYAKPLREMIDEAIARRYKMPAARMPKRLHDDQYHFHRYFVRHHEKVCIDYFNSLFICLTGVPENELILDSKNKRLYFVETNSNPLVIHGNGCGLPLLEKIFVKYYPDVLPDQGEKS